MILQTLIPRTRFNLCQMVVIHRNITYKGVRH